MKTVDLIGPALDWAVAKCEGNIWTGDWYLCPAEFSFKIGKYPKGWAVAQSTGGRYSPSTDWGQGGPIIEREGIAIQREIIVGTTQYQWKAYMPYQHAYGPTPLVAAMRCYVTSKLGDEVEIQEELL